MSKPAVFNFGDHFEAPTPNVGDKPATIDLGPEGQMSGELNPNPIVSSLATGLRDVPLAGALFEKAITEGFGVDKELLEEMARVSNSTPWGKGLAFATSMVPEMLIGGGAFSLGRKALVAGLRASVPEAMAALAAPTAAGGRAATALGRVAARGMDEAGGSAALKALGIAGPIVKPGIERGAEILGGSLGVGGFYGGASLAEGDDPTTALAKGAYAAALTGGIEGALTVAGKALFSGAREVDVGKLIEATENSPMYQASKNLEVGKLQDKLTALNERMMKLHTTPATDFSKLQNLGLAIKKTEVELGAAKFFTEMDPLFRQYLRETPRNRASATQTILLKLAKTPEQLAGEMGPAVAKVVELGRQAGAATSVARSITNREMAEVEHMAQRGMGVTRHAERFKARETGGAYLLDAIDSWQRTGNPVVTTAKDPAKLTQAFGHLDELMQKAEHSLVDAGLIKAPLLPPPGSLKGFPVVLDRLTPAGLLRPKGPEELANQLAGAMAKLNGVSKDSALGSAMKAVMGAPDKPGRFGTSTRNVWSMFDETSVAHLFPGKSFKEIVEAGAPIVRDPIVAVETYLNSIARQVAYAKRLGPGGRLARGPMRAMAMAQGANGQLYDHIVNAVLGSSYGTIAEQSLASAITNTQTATRMGLGVIPNAAQFVNIGLLTGPQSLIKGLFSRFQQGPVREAAEASAINDSLIRSWRESFLDPYTRTPFGRAADWVLNHTGFSAVERWNRLWAFHASANYAGKTLTKAVDGRLRGATLDVARRRFNGLGKNLDELVQLARKQSGGTAAEKVEALLLSGKGELISDLGMGGVRQTQFLPDKTRLPTFWNTPGGRVAFQFKSFALNQARLVRDTVFNEVAKGNMGPMLYYMASFPVAGELVTDLRQMVKDGELKRPTSPLVRLVDNATAVGAFGLASDVYRGAVWGPEQVYRAAMGPTVEDGAYLLNALVSRDFDRVVKRASNLPTARAAWGFGTLGLGAAMEGTARLRDALEVWQGEGDAEAQGDEVAAPTLQQLQAQRAQPHR